MGYLDGVTPLVDLPQSNLWVIYGKSGSGKTQVASTFPKPLLYLRFADDGSGTIKDVEGISAIEVTSIEMLKSITLELKKDTKYKTVVVDTFSLIVNEWTDENAIQKKKRLSQQMWGDMKTDQEELIKLFHQVSSSKVVVLTCHEASDTIQGYEDEITPDIRPSVSKGARTYLEGMSNFGIHTTVVEKEKILSTGEVKTVFRYAAHISSSPYYWTKTQKSSSIKLPGLVYNPTYTKIMKLMEDK